MSETCGVSSSGDACVNFEVSENDIHEKVLSVRSSHMHVKVKYNT
jgi:hypothetical protein